MAQAAKCLPRKREELSSDPQAGQEKPGIAG